MMEVIINDKELGKITVGVRDFPTGIRSSMMEAIIDVAHRIRNTMLLSMRETPKAGRHYRRGKRWHIASSPGNPPAIDTGELIRSIIPPDIRTNEVEVGVEAGGAPYAVELEGGRANMEPRPFIGPALEKQGFELEISLTDAIRKAAEEAFKK